MEEKQKESQDVTETQITEEDGTCLNAKYRPGGCTLETAAKLPIRARCGPVRKGIFYQVNGVK